MKITKSEISASRATGDDGKVVTYYPDGPRAGQVNVLQSVAHAINEKLPSRVGTITVDEVYALLETYGAGLQRAQVSSMMSALTRDGWQYWQGFHSYSKGVYGWVTVDEMEADKQGLVDANEIGYDSLSAMLPVSVVPAVPIPGITSYLKRGPEKKGPFKVEKSKAKKATSKKAHQPVVSSTLQDALAARLAKKMKAEQSAEEQVEQPAQEVAA